MFIVVLLLYVTPPMFVALLFDKSEFMIVSFAFVDIMIDVSVAVLFWIMVLFSVRFPLFFIADAFWAFVLTITRLFIVSVIVGVIVKNCFVFVPSIFWLFPLILCFVVLCLLLLLD